MYENHGWKITLCLLVLCGFGAAWAAFPLQLGLDLQGGSHLIYEIDPSEIYPEEKRTPETTDAIIEVLQNRLDSLGLKELELRRYGLWGIEVQLPGYSPEETQRIKDLIEQAGVLWFKLVARNQDRQIIQQLRDLKDRGLYNAIRYYDPNDAPDLAWLAQRYGHEVPRGGAEQEAARQELRDELAARYHEEMGPLVARHGENVREYDMARHRDTGNWMLLENDQAIPGSSLTEASVQRNPQYGVVVAFSFDPDGAARFADLTRQNEGRRFAIVLDGQVQSAPTINEPITGGSGIIHGQFTIETANDLVIVLQAGALPEGAEPREVSSLNVGPQLGQASIRSGAMAAIIALVLVIFFIIYYYGPVAGVIADTALVVNMVIILGFLALFEATLTLPGIAGIILTMGMAIDANILIFERIREELRRGGGNKRAVKEGYARAFWVIFDANITTVLTAIVLFLVGTGPIKGFAVTLIVGISASMFTALFLTRTIFGVLIGKKVIEKDLSFRAWVPKDADWDFMSSRGTCVKISLVVIACGFLLWTARGQKKYGIDFTGGTRVQVALSQPMTKADLVDVIAGIERTRDGRTVRPYPATEVEVQAAGEADAEGRASRYIITRRVVGRTDYEEAATGEEPTIETFVNDLRESLDDRLAPRGFDRLGSRGEPWEIIEVADGGPADGEDGPDGSTGNGPPVEAPDEEEGGAPPSDLGPEPPRQTPDGANDRGNGAEGETGRRVRVRAHLVETPGRELGTGSITEYLRGVEREGEHPWSDAMVEEVEEEIPGVRTFEVTSGAVDPGRTEETGRQLIADLRDTERSGLRFSDPFPSQNVIGDSIAHNLKTKAFLAILLSCVIIIIYITFRFEFFFGVAAVMALSHDVLITMGAIALIDLLTPVTGLYVKVDLASIAAFLTVIGYSLNDTIVVFDRVRENLQDRRVRKAKDPRSKMVEVVNGSINETLARTVMTSLTTFVTVLILLLSGVAAIEGFAVALLIGIVTGTYSSIFVASPTVLAEPRKIGWIMGGVAAFLILVQVGLPFLIG